MVVAGPVGSTLWKVEKSKSCDTERGHPAYFASLKRAFTSHDAKAEPIGEWRPAFHETGKSESWAQKGRHFDKLWHIVSKQPDPSRWLVPFGSLQRSNLGRFYPPRMERGGPDYLKRSTKGISDFKK